jgi:hypothetical protein
MRLVLRKWHLSVSKLLRTAPLLQSLCCQSSRAQPFPPDSGMCAINHKLHALKHEQEKINGAYRRVFLSALGLVVKVGHHGPGPCQHAANEVNLLIQHTTGYNPIKAQFCACPGHPPRRIQFLLARWWPTSGKLPIAGATWDLLQWFYVLNMQCNINATDFSRSLELLTDAWRLSKMPVR